LLEVLNTYADGLAEEPAECLHRLHDPDAENTVWLFEVFKDEQAQAAHRQPQGSRR
jgi:quinol monooxygenase YgiN